MKRLEIIVLLLVGLSSCGIYRPYGRPSDIHLSDTLRVPSWQTFFQDPVLTDLIDTALARNADIRTAELNLYQAEQSLRSSRLQWLPELTASGSWSTPAATEGSLPVRASWQHAVPGSLVNGRRYAEEAVKEGDAALRGVQAEMVADVATLYYMLATLDGRSALTAESVTMWEKTVKAATVMKEAGLVHEEALAQYEAALAAVRTSGADLAYQRSAVLRSLSSLLGREVEDFEAMDGSLELPLSLVDGIPVEWLGARPDVAMAERRLAEAWYQVRMARSQLYPSVSLTAGVDLAGLLTSVGASLTQPLLQAGSLVAGVRSARAEQEKALVAFRQALLDAALEVKDILDAYEADNQKVELLEKQVEALQRAAGSTRLSMEYGSVSYLEVLTVEKSLLSARDALVQARAACRQDSIRLYHALGGGSSVEKTYICPDLK
ncbi:MAG: TolC family protein [Bacteroidales bacterium]|nr:TolC family protein [Bacteroidales bacterium]